MKISLKGKFGANPTLSRNCENGAMRKEPLSDRWEGCRRCDVKSGDLPFLVHARTYVEIGGDCTTKS